MKYVRTKDKIYEVIEENDNYYKCCYNDESITLVSKFDNDAYGFSKALKESDTIDELCDGFWWENEMYTDPIFIPNYALAIDRIDAWKESDKELNTNLLSKIKVYASIYVKGFGWKHIAKLNNENGDLELL